MADLASFWPSLEPQISWVHTLLRRLGVRDRDVQDVVQRALIALHAHWSEYHPKRPLRPWLRVFVHRAAADYRKLAGVRHETLFNDVDAMSAIVDETPSAEANLEAHERRALLMDALDELDFDRRTVLVLAEFEELPVPEIAAMLDLPVATVHSRLRLARVDITRVVRRLAARRSHR